MRTFKTLRAALVAAFVVVVMGVQLKWDHKSSSLEAQALPKTPRVILAETCGACHSNLHNRPAGHYQMQSAALAITPGVFAQSAAITNPFTPTTPGEPLTALVIQKPLEGSVTPHGGIKIPATHEAIQLLTGLVDGSIAMSVLDYPAPTSVHYLAAVGNEHVIIVARRTFKNTGFGALRGFSNGGKLIRVSFVYDGNAVANVTPTDLFAAGSTTNNTGAVIQDAQQPSLSLDGSRVVFACKLQNRPGWTLCEVPSIGGAVREVPNLPTQTVFGDTANHIDPFYLPYLPDGTPARDGSGGFGFLSDHPGFQDEYNTGMTLSLHVADKDGGHFRQIDFNPSHDLHPELHSSGGVLFTRWEHNEHQGHNFMSVFELTAADYMSAGTNIFGVFGEHNFSMGNSMHEPSEILLPNYGQNQNLLVPAGTDPATYGLMVGRRSSRDAEGGSLVGPFFPRLQGTVGSHPVATTLAEGDNVDMEENEDIDPASLIGWTYRQPRSLVGGQFFIVGQAVLTHVTDETDPITMEVEHIPHYGEWRLMVTHMNGNVFGPMLPLLEDNTVDPDLDPGQPAGLLNYADYDLTDINYEDAIPVVVRPTPMKMGKPLDLNQSMGTFTSGNVTKRQADGQPNNFTRNDISVVRFVRALQLSQGRINTGRRNDDGIATAIVGEAPIAPDGSFSAMVPANVPMQFQVLDKNGRVLVNHKPWVHVAPGATERCVGCHATHNENAEPQTLMARTTPAGQITTSEVDQFNFHRDIQPIFDRKCVVCHDSALIHGAAGRERSLSLVGRWTPAGTTESYQLLVGGEGMMEGDYVETQKSRESKLMWWLTGIQYNGVNESVYPAANDPLGPDKVSHPSMVTEEDITKIARWIDTGINFRVTAGDEGKITMDRLNIDVFNNTLWPKFFEPNCMPCHSGTAGGAGSLAMNLDGVLEADDTPEEIQENRRDELGRRVNYMIPGASTLLRKPLGAQLGGLHHVGGIFFTGLYDPNYLAIFNWIAATNAKKAVSMGNVSDLISPSSYPNPFRDMTTFVYGLSGSVINKVDINVYTKDGKLIREFNGMTDSSNGGAVGWNKVNWDGKDKNGKTVGTDVYFYTINVEFGDGTKKKYRGKCVKVR